MATLNPKPPSSHVPMFDPETGLVSREWYRYFQDMAKQAADHEARIAALEP